MTEDDFKETVVQIFHDRVQDLDFANRLWGSLANVEWQKDGHGFLMTFRQAGRVIAEMRGDTSKYNYMTHYCSVPDGEVDPDVAAAFATRGYTPETDSSRWIT